MSQAAGGGEETSRDAAAEQLGSPAAVIQHGPSPPASAASPATAVSSPASAAATINGLSVRAAEAVAMSVLAGMGSGQPGGGIIDVPLAHSQPTLR